MTQQKRIIIGQLNFRVGDIEYNADNIIRAALTARDEFKADAILFPEMTLTGYPPDDLVYRQEIYQRQAKALEHIGQQVKHIDMILGLPWQENDRLYNAAILLRDGEIQQRYFKQKLPNYSVFDEKRYFTPGQQSCVFAWHGLKLAILICEDMWHREPMQQAKAEGAQLILGLNASPFNYQKAEQRLQVLQQRVAENGLPIIYSHWHGGQDEIVFDGGSLVLNASGDVCVAGDFFREQLIPVDINISDIIAIKHQVLPTPMQKTARIYQALLLGIQDYVEKNDANGVVIGLSGGIDSALVLCLAVDALGSERVEAVMMPSQYTADISLEDAELLANNLGVHYHQIPIEPIVAPINHSLSERFKDLLPDVTEENIQARTRGLLLMAISNKTGKLVLTTGNKSELAVGYCTLYGDTAGAFAPLKDVLKTLVYDLARYRNGIAPIMPERIITRPPSAELAPEQMDHHSLPPYDVLDAIIELYVEQDASIDDIVDAGFAIDTVKQVLSLIDRSEYKRRQCPPGIRITTKAFGRDRRYPITSSFHSISSKEHHDEKS